MCRSGGREASIFFLATPQEEHVPLRGWEVRVFFPATPPEDRVPLRGWELRVFFLTMPPAEHLWLRGWGTWRLDEGCQPFGYVSITPHIRGWWKDVKLMVLDIEGSG